MVYVFSFGNVGYNAGSFWKNAVCKKYQLIDWNNGGCLRVYFPHDLIEKRFFPLMKVNTTDVSFRPNNKLIHRLIQSQCLF